MDSEDHRQHEHTQTKTQKHKERERERESETTCGRVPQVELTPFQEGLRQAMCCRGVLDGDHQRQVILPRQPARVQQRAQLRMVQELGQETQRLYPGVLPSSLDLPLPLHPLLTEHLQPAQALVQPGAVAQQVRNAAVALLPRAGCAHERKRAKKTGQDRKGGAMMERRVGSEKREREKHTQRETHKKRTHHKRKKSPGIKQS